MAAVGKRLAHFASCDVKSTFLWLILLLMMISALLFCRSLILVVVLVFGCIVVSFVLSSLKQRHDIESWTMMAGTAFNHLATTVIGKHGIIQPRLHYQSNKKDNGNGGGGGGAAGGGRGAAAAAAENNARRGTAEKEEEDAAAERLRTLQGMGDWGR